MSGSLRPLKVTTVGDGMVGKCDSDYYSNSDLISAQNPFSVQKLFN